ncbi:MAG: hypothetical protein MK171_06530 [Pirellulales bacterium]|nr:hypothetical protein [Pirellulales bacterium]
MSSVIVYLPPPTQKRAFQLMLAQAKQVRDEGESVILTHCDLQAGTCSANLMGSRLICSACRYSTRKSVADTGLELVHLRQTQDESGALELARHDRTELLEGVNSCLITLVRVLKNDLNRNPLLRWIKRRNFRTATVLFKAMTALMKTRQVHRIEVLNGRYACMKIGLIAAQRFGLDYNTLDFSCVGRPMVFRGHTPHDRKAIQQRIRRSPPDEAIAQQYYMARKDKRFNPFAGRHQISAAPCAPRKTQKKVAFFLSSQDECESLGPEWRSPFQKSAEVVRQACEEFPDYFFCVRFHPNQANILSDITSEFRQLQHLSNVEIYYPDDQVDSYSLIEWSDLVVTFASTVAVEACWAGKAVVQLGPSFFDELGISYTPKSTSEFLQLLGTNLKASPRRGAAQFANYDMNDFDDLKYLEYSSGAGKPIGFCRKGSVFATPAKKINFLVNKFLRTAVGLGISHQLRP